MEGEDVINTIKAMKLLGVQIKKKKEKYHVFGIPTGGLHEPSKTIDFGNSGTGIRLISGLISSNSIEAKLVGDNSLNKRPMKRVTEHLSKIGAKIELKKNLFPPIKLKGTGNAIPLTFEILIPSAQIKSAIMLSALNTNGKVKIKSLKQQETTQKICLSQWGIILKLKKTLFIDL